MVFEDAFNFTTKAPRPGCLAGVKHLCLSLLVICPCLTSSAAKPNILVIYSDDHGWADLGAQGVNDEIRTPHLDQLARDGVRCTRGYVSAPQCVPSRAGVLTGRYQQRFGLEDNTQGPLPLEEVTLAERLKPAGYLSGQVGKWHLDLRAETRGGGKKDRAPMPAHMPHGQGFDEYWRGETRRFLASHDLQGTPFADAPHAVEDSRFRVDVQTEAALAFLHRRQADADVPWFLYLAYFTPHVPLESPEPWFSKTPAHLAKERRQALAMIAAMDDGIGQIRAKLTAMGQSENTVIFFIGDNGAPTHDGHWDGSVNKPLVGEKGMLADGGVRVPFLVAWPGTVPAGGVYEHPVMNLDVAATANALAGLPPDARLDGVNLIPHLKGENPAPPHEALFWRWRSQAAVLEFPWKLVRLGPTERFLWDVTRPEGEGKNLLGAHPEIAARLEAKLKQWSDELRPPGLPVAIHPQDAQFFAGHIDPRFAAQAPKKKAAESGAIHGWLCRNGRLSQQKGALVVEGEHGNKGAPFLTISSVDVTGPARLTIRSRSGVEGLGSVAFRLRQEADFDPKNRVPFTWASGDVSASIASSSRIIHLRIHLPPQTPRVEIERISLEVQGRPPMVWDFSQP